jgi:outer membrane murein-binding lipoprotein Lpp
VSKSHKLMAGAALAALIGVSGCGHGLPDPRSAAVGQLPSFSVLADAQARLDALRRDADGTPSPAAQVAWSGAARADANADCESETADPRFSCHRYRLAILATR